MEFLKEVPCYETHCEHQTCAQQKTNLKLFEEILNFYCHLYKEQIKDETDVKTHELAIILIHGKIIRTLQCNLDLLKKGHYSEFRSLLRDVFELIFLSKYIMANPDKGDPWLDGEEIKHRHIANTLNLPTEIREIYGGLCNYTHPNFKGAEENIILDRKCKSIDYLLVPMFRRKIAKPLLIMQIHFTFIAIDHFFVCFKKYNNFTKDDEKLLNRIKKKLPKSVDPLTKYCDELQLDI